MKITCYNENNCLILIAEVNESIDELKPLLANFNDYEAEFMTINTIKRKKEFITVRILMNILLQKNVIITYNKNNKPFLTESPYSISISHSGDFFALAASDYAEPGIDIEKRTSRVLGVSKRFVNDQETAFLYNGHTTNGLEIAWSAKEALFKRIGKEASDFHTIRICPFKPGESGSFMANFLPSNTGYTLFYYQNENYTLVYSI